MLWSMTMMPAFVRGRWKALKQFADEQHVRAAFMHTLQNDNNAGIRIGAINALLERNAKDPELGEKLQEVTKVTIIFTSATRCCNS